MEPVALLAKLIRREDLSSSEAAEFFEALMDERLEPGFMGGTLAALAAKGETVTEIVAAAHAMRRRACPVRVPAGVDAIDTCGTGGDGRAILNVSTAAAIVAAAAGATVAKHGNRSNTRPSGSAEVLEALGVNIAAEVGVLERCLERCRIAFLYAPRLHPAMKAAAPVRRALGVRTIFNLVGPLANPAGVRRQLVGVNRAALVEPMLEALRQLGAERAMVVHGLEGLCDLSVSGPSRVGRFSGNRMEIEEVNCSVAGLRQGALRDLEVTGPGHSAALIRGVLAGESSPARDIVVFNASAALWVAGLARDWQEGAARACAAIDGGLAMQTLAAWAVTSHGGA